MTDWDAFMDWCAETGTDNTPENFQDWKDEKEAAEEDRAADLMMDRLIYGNDYV